MERESTPTIGDEIRLMRKRLPGRESEREALASKLGVTKETLALIESNEMAPPPQAIEWLEDRKKANLPPPVRSRSGVLESVLSVHDFKPGSWVLDAPSGEGRLTWELTQKGCRAVPLDLFPEIVQTPETPPVGADLNGTLPFADESFDTVVSVEGVEHLENPWRVYREFSRVLKPSGRLIVTTPNYSNIERRVSYLIKGSAVRPPLPEECSPERIAEEGPPHLAPLSLCYWKLAGELGHFKLVKLTTVSKRKNQIFYWPLAALIVLSSRLAKKKTYERYSMEWTQTMDLLLGGRSLLMVFEKTGPAAD